MFSRFLARKTKISFTVGILKNKQKNMVVELQAYLGEKTPNTSVEDTAQYLPYKYTPFKDESEGSQQTFVLYRYY